MSPSAVPVAKALQNLAKAINVAFEGGFLENELESVYKGARVRKGTVEIMHSEYIGLGDGVFAKIGRFAKSVQLTFRGPDPAPPPDPTDPTAITEVAVPGMLKVISWLRLLSKAMPRRLSRSIHAWISPGDFVTPSLMVRLRLPGSIAPARILREPRPVDLFQNPCRSASDPEHWPEVCSSPPRCW